MIRDIIGLVEKVVAGVTRRLITGIKCVIYTYIELPEKDVLKRQISLRGPTCVIHQMHDLEKSTNSRHVV